MMDMVRKVAINNFHRKGAGHSLAEGTDHLPLKPYVLMSLALGVIYGLFMGLYAVLTREPPCYEQLLSGAIKVPALFLLTLVVTFPSLYVFSALFGARLGLLETLRVLVAAVVVNLAVLASFGPITGFFTLSTTSYHFMKLLNVLFFAIAGMIGLGFLMSVLQRLEAARKPSPGTLESTEGPAEHPDEPDTADGSAEKPDETTEDTNDPQPPCELKDESAGNDIRPGAGSIEGDTSGLMPFSLPPQKTTARNVFKVWLVLYSLVGAQMGWVLRPFVGAPDLPFVLFREREANIFVDVLRTLGELLGG